MVDEEFIVPDDKVDSDTLRQKIHSHDSRGPDKINNYNNIIKVVVVAVIGLFIIVGVAMCQAPKEPTGPPKACFKYEQCIDLILATTAAQQELGLSGYDSLAADKGMLFIFDKPGSQRMWMKDMNFHIDIFWLDDKGKILHIEKKAIPCESDACEIFEYHVPAKYVLETNAGFAIEKNLYDGDKVVFSNLPTD